MSDGTVPAAARLRRFFVLLALAAAALTFVVIVASAFMRHTQAGLGCADWPACYARIATDSAETPPSTGVRIARIAHRIAATSVLALVVGMLLVAWTQRPVWRRERRIALAALVVTVGLAVLGIATPGTRLPAVTLGNLVGGYLMLALLAALAATATRAEAAPASSAAPAAPLRWIAFGALALAFAQAAAGGMIGAQYALTACPTLGKCEGFPFDEFRFGAAFDAWRPLVVADGRVVPPAGGAAPYVVHRAAGIVVAIVVLVLGHALRRTDRRRALALAALALAAPLAGVAAIVAVPSLPLTVLHNATAALLIAALAHVVARPATA